MCYKCEKQQCSSFCECPCHSEKEDDIVVLVEIENKLRQEFTKEENIK